MKVKLIDPENKSIARALGITPEREKELDTILEAEFENAMAAAQEGRDTTVTEQLERLTLYSTHANETAYLCYTMGAVHGKIKTIGDMGPLGLIGMMMGGRGKRDGD